MLNDRPAGQPLDRLFATYLLIGAIPLVLPNRPAVWLPLLALHLVVVLLAWPPAPVQRAIDAARKALPRLSRVLLDWYPLLLVPPLYAELALLNRAVHDGAYFDTWVQQWEQAVFGWQPSRNLADALPLPWLSELLHFGYLSYYFIIFVPPLLLYTAARYAAFRRAVFTLMLAFFLHYLFFIYFPVQGPRYIFPAPDGRLADGFFYQLAHRILEAGSSQGAAFPSSHVGVSVAQVLTAVRLQPRLAPALGVLTALLALGAVYGGFHYAIDATGGLLLGSAAAWLAPSLYRRLGGEW